jgi:hypothetical protein
MTSPLGLWLVSLVGYPLVFIAGALLALVAAATVIGLPGGTPSSEEPLR